jgi:hypothetical protein
MITQNTLLVLGAGASIPYGFPSGAQLRNEILSSGGNYRWRQNLLALSFSEADIQRFRESFLKSQARSIDFFLQNQPEFLAIGKAAISAILLERELEGNLLESLPNQGHWYRTLWDSLAIGWDALEKNKLKIITFNYDRSLEYYLTMAMANLYGKSWDASLEKVDSLKIHHVYGSLGSLHPKRDPNKFVDFSGDLSSEKITRAAENISLARQGEPSDQRDFFSELYNWATRIFFLGFSYAPPNLEQIYVKELIASGAGSTKFIAGTTVGMEGKERESLRVSCGFTVDHHELILTNADCEIALRRYAVLT